MTDQPGWTAPQHGEDPERGRDDQPAAPPTPSTRWAVEQPPPASGWGPAAGQPAGQAWQPAGAAAPPAGPAWTPAGQAWQPPPLKPGVIPLRPLGVGEVLDGAISTIRANPKVMLGLSALLAAATQLVMVPATKLLLGDAGRMSFSGEPTSTEEEISYTADAVTAAALQGIVTLLATLVLTGVLTVVLSKAVLGQQISAGEAWAQARPRLPRLFAVTVLVFLLELLVAVVTVGPAVLLAVAGAPTALVVIAFVLGIPAAIVVGVYLYVALALAPASIVLERQRVLASLRRSRFLVKGAWWRTFGILLLVNVIAYFISAIISVPFVAGTFGAAYLSGGSDDLDLYGWAPLVISALGTIAGAAIAWPFTAVSTGLLYVDRRIRREALDMELARAAGLAPAGQSATPSVAPEPSPGDRPGQGYGG